jgi:hypothetical protein
LLGHNLTDGIVETISTGGGSTKAYRHTSTITIYHPDNPDNQIIHTIENVLIDCMSGLPVVLLGVNGFLSGFKLIIDYPNKKFSLLSPTE